MEDLSHRAQQGSLTAMTQILNDELREIGVTIKIAVTEKGVLQILCEAGHPENLDKPIILRYLQRSLQDIAPRAIRDVYIRSRLTNDTQCLWVANLTPEARRKLLWSEKIQIQHLSFWEKLLPPQQKPRQQHPLRRRLRLNYTTKVILGTMFGTIACGGLSWLVSDWWQLKFRALAPVTVPITVAAKSDRVTPQGQPAVSEDAFTQAVRLANQAALDGQTAASYGEWLSLATRWQQASALMASVAQNHPRYTEAQIRVLSYRQNSEAALAQAHALAPVQNP